MTAALLEVKQKLASNFDQSISESIDDVLTRDNLHLSESKSGENYLFQRAVNYKMSSTSRWPTTFEPASRREPNGDLERFEIWGGQIPAPPEMVYREGPELERGRGTKRTNRPGLTMSVHRGRPEVIGASSNRRA